MKSERLLVVQILLQNVTTRESVAEERNEDHIARMGGHLPRVLVVQGDESTRRVLDVAMRRAGYAVRVLSDGTCVREVADEFRPDLAVLDVLLPEGPGGYEVARMLRGGGDLPILFLSAADALEDRLAGFAAGGDDYLGKPFAVAELLARAEALLRRAGRLVSQTWEVADLVVDDAARAVRRAGEPIDLTHTEYDLLSALARNVGHVLSKSQLLAQVWGFDAYDSNVVEVHVSALRRKLEGVGPRLVHTVRGAGYVLHA